MQRDGKIVHIQSMGYGALTEIVRGCGESGKRKE
jgi:hypothetical protein